MKEIVRTEQEKKLLDTVSTALDPYVFAWRASLSYREGMQGCGRAWSKSGLGYNASVTLPDGRGDGVVYEEKLDAMLYSVVCDATGLRYGEIVPLIRENAVGFHSGTNYRSDRPGGLFRSLDILGVRAIENTVSRIARRLPSSIEMASVPDGAVLLHHLDDPDKLLRDQHEVGVAFLFETLGTRDHSIKKFEAFLSQADARIAQMLAERNKVSGYASIQRAGRRKAAEQAGLPTTQGFFPPSKPHTGDNNQ